VGVREDHGLIPLVLLPGKITRMMIANQDHPLRPRFAEARTFDGAPIHNPSSSFRFAEGVGARIDGIGEHGLKPW
jgi:hypothetical protein